MACKRRRRGAWVVDWTDSTGRRRWKTCADEAQADLVLADVLRAGRLAGGAPPGDPTLTVAEYARTWLAWVEPTLRHRTLDSYRDAVELHLVPALGHHRLAELRGRHLEDWIHSMIRAGQKPTSAAHRLAVARAMLQRALRQDLIATNPAASLVRDMRLFRDGRPERTALDAGQARSLLAALEAQPEHHVTAVLMLTTGIRIGEAAGLRWDDFAPDWRRVRIERQVDESGEIGAPKTRKSRRAVDVAPTTADLLVACKARRQEAALRRGEKASPWLCAEPETSKAWRDRFAHALDVAAGKAGVPRITPHCLRHTYASLMLSAGTSPYHVQDQLGHATIEQTLHYGSHLRSTNPAAADALARAVV